MGDTLQATKQPKSSGQIPEHKSRSQSPASNQPRKFDQLTESSGGAARSSALKQGDNSMRLEIGNYSNLSPHGLQPQTSRHNSSPFLFTNPRQDSLSLLGNFPMGQNTPPGSRASGLSSYYPSNREFSTPVQAENRTLLRGDSICLPPPVVTGKYDENQASFPGSSSSGPSQSRSTSIFSSLIQMPGSSSNSFSGPSQKEIKSGAKEPGKEPGKDSISGKDISSKDITAREGSLNLEYLQDYDSINRDSLSNIFGWNQDAKMAGPSNPSSKRNTKMFDNQNAFWEQFNAGTTSSIAGISSDNMNAILSSIQSNPSIDLSSMNNEQRRDSILRYINDQGKGPKQNTKTPLREDIFEEPKTLPAAHSDGRRPSNVSHLSPTSSMSSKTSHKIQEEPQSPKGSPGQSIGAQMQFVQPQSSLQKKSSTNYSSPEQNINLSYSQHEKEALVQYPPNIAMQPGLLPVQQQMSHQQHQQMQQHQIQQQLQHQRPLQQPNQTLLYPYQTHEQLRQMKKNNYKTNYSPQYPIPLPQQQMQQNQYLRGANTYQPMINNAANFRDNYQRDYQREFQRDQNFQKDANVFQRDANMFQKDSFQKENFPKDGALGDAPFFQSLTNQPSTYENGRPLVPAQQYARAEDGRPLLGATKVDQLMLVIQAREKGNKGAIRQAPDGSIIAPPNPDHDKSAVLPSSVDLVGGTEKVKDTEENGHDDKRRKRRAKNQECPYCFKKFNQSTHLDVHVRSHIGYKPFQCNYCQKRFTQGGNLRTHLRLHTGEKPFSCDVCNRSFSRKGNLAAHMLTHNKEKPFECKLDNCDKSFTQLGNLKSHQNKFHLPTLTKLTQTFSSITGDALDRLPKEERSMLDYFAGLYKNSNKGIRGRGKG